MSLIADALNKLKKEREELGDDRISAPPSLRNAIVNNEKYKEFVKRTEMRDSEGKTPNIKGFIAVSIILVTIIIVTVYAFIKKENNSLVAQAGIVSQPAGAGQVESLGKPYTGKPYVKPVEEVKSVSQQPQAVNINKNNVPKDIKAVQNQSAQKENVSTSEYSNKDIMFYVVTDTDNMDKNNSVERQKKDKESYNDTFFFDSNNNVQEKKDISRESLSNEKAGNVNKTNNENKAVSSSVILKDEYKSADNIKLSKSDSLLYQKYITDGQKCEQDNQYGCAIDNYKKAYLIKNDENVSAVISLLYIKEGNANLSFQNVVTSGMTNPALIKSIALYMIKNKNYNECRKLLQYANTLDKSNHILFANGYYNYDMKNYGDAVKYFVEASEDNKNDGLSLLYAGYAYKKLDNKESAVKMFQKILNIAGVQQDIKNAALKNIKELQGIN